MSENRTQKSIKNVSSKLIVSLITYLLKFIAQKVFIVYLGKSYLGINGLLTNVLSMLSLAELGVGTAISFSLYKPLADKDEKKVLILMNFYKKAYRIIGIVVFAMGLCLVPFLDKIIKDPGDVKNITFIYLVYLFNTSYSYLMTYKNTLIEADQQAYKLSLSSIIYNIVLVITQIIILVVTHNYIFYLISNSIVLFIQRLYVNRYITKLYPILKEKTHEKLPKEEFKVIIKNIKAMLYHKIGEYCINGTDNIIISAFISVSIVGLYSNYSMIINMINTVIMMCFGTLTSSVGNVLVTENNEKKEEIFKQIDFIGFWLFCFSSVCLYNLLNPFIEICFGKDYVISQGIVAIVILNFYLTGMRVPASTVKSAAGLYDQDKFTPLIQSAINLIVSIVCVKKMGLFGVFLGTLVSSIALPCWQRPQIIYKYVFEKSSRDYFKVYFKYLIFTLVNVYLVNGIGKLFFNEVNIVNFIIKVFICIIFTNGFIILFFRKSKEFKKLIDIIDSLLGGKIKWIKRLV